jgi:hypothetical protein
MLDTYFINSNALIVWDKDIDYQTNSFIKAKIIDSDNKVLNESNDYFLGYLKQMKGCIKIIPIDISQIPFKVYKNKNNSILEFEFTNNVKSFLITKKDAILKKIRDLQDEEFRKNYKRGKVVNTYLYMNDKLYLTIPNIEDNDNKDNLVRYLKDNEYSIINIEKQCY